MSGAVSSAPSRSRAVDALRGLAIISMLAANLAGPCLRAPHPLWLRAFGSLAAPAFVLLAGMMTTSSSGPRPMLRLLRRSAWLLALAAGIDVLCWGITPFETFDVLYLLGLALPVAWLCLRLPVWLHWLSALVLLAVTPWLQDSLGYGPLLPDQLAYPWPSWRRALVDGWFPIFPWLGVALLGSVLGRAGASADGSRRRLALGGAVLAGLGAGGWWLAPPSLVTRDGYSELFYPPSAQFLALALGAVLLLLAGLQACERRSSLRWLTSLGRASLTLYVVHVALIALVLEELFEDRTLPEFLGLYATLALTLSALAWLLQRYRLRLAPRRALDGRDGAAGTTGR